MGKIKSGLRWICIGGYKALQMHGFGIAQQKLWRTTEFHADCSTVPVCARLVSPVMMHPELSSVSDFSIEFLRRQFGT